MIDELVFGEEIIQGCTRPVYFHTPDPDFPIINGPSSFVAQLNHRRFLVTARHNFKGQRPRDILIPREQASLEPMIVRGLKIPHAPPEEDPGAADVAFFEIDSSQLTASQLALLCAVPLSPTLISEEWLKPKQPLVVAGYPYNDSDISYEDRATIIDRNCIAFAGTYDGPSEDPMCHCLRFEAGYDLRPTNGLSGSPVFTMQPHPTHPQFIFAGVFVQGTSSGGEIGRFVGSKAIVKLLTEVIIGVEAEEGSITDPIRFDKN